MVYGNPARIHGYSGAAKSTPAGGAVASIETGELAGGARLIRIRRAEDMRGSLTAIEFGSDLPFVPARLFSVFGVRSAEVRGEHAHRACQQLLMSVSGSLSVLLDDGNSRDEVTLDDPGIGLYMPAMIWGTQFGYSQDSILVVLASLPYDPNDYIRDYEEFLLLKGASASDLSV